MAYGSGLPHFFPSLTYQCRPRCEQLAASSDATSVTLDLGAGGRRIASHVTTIDMRPFSGTDVVASVYDLPIKDETADLVFATGLLEHLEDDRPFLREAHRVLKTGGTIHVEVPFLQQYHEDPIDLRRCTVPGVKLLLEQNDFEPLDGGFHIGPSVTFFTISAYYAALLFEGKAPLHKLASNAAFMFVSCIGYPLRSGYNLKKQEVGSQIGFRSVLYCYQTRKREQ